MSRVEEVDLTTGRLALTGPRASDAAAFVDRWVRHWEEHGFGYWCVREPGADDIVGYAGVKRMEVHGRPVLNLVYRFVPEVWGEDGLDHVYSNRPEGGVCAGGRGEASTA